MDEYIKFQALYTIEKGRKEKDSETDSLSWMDWGWNGFLSCLISHIQN
jgi:hypothetical protein